MGRRKKTDSNKGAPAVAMSLLVLAAEKANRAVEEAERRENPTMVPRTVPEMPGREHASASTSGSALGEMDHRVEREVNDAVLPGTSGTSENPERLMPKLVVRRLPDDAEELARDRATAFERQLLRTQVAKMAGAALRPRSLAVLTGENRDPTVPEKWVTDEMTAQRVTSEAAGGEVEIAQDSANISNPSEDHPEISDLHSQRPLDTRHSKANEDLLIVDVGREEEPPTMSTRSASQETLASTSSFGPYIPVSQLDTGLKAPEPVRADVVLRERDRSRPIVREGNLPILTRMLDGRSVSMHEYEEIGNNPTVEGPAIQANLSLYQGAEGLPTSSGLQMARQPIVVPPPMLLRGQGVPSISTPALNLTTTPRPPMPPPRLTFPGPPPPIFIHPSQMIAMPTQLPPPVPAQAPPPVVATAPPPQAPRSDRPATSPRPRSASESAASSGEGSSRSNTMVFMTEPVIYSFHDQNLTRKIADCKTDPIVKPGELRKACLYDGRLPLPKGFTVPATVEGSQGCLQGLKDLVRNVGSGQASAQGLPAPPKRPRLSTNPDKLAELWKVARFPQHPVIGNANFPKFNIREVFQYPGRNQVRPRQFPKYQGYLRSPSFLHQTSPAINTAMMPSFQWMTGNINIEELQAALAVSFL